MKKIILSLLALILISTNIMAQQKIVQTAGREQLGDFAPEFAEALSGADELLLCEIYPARELPIEGVTSDLIFRDVKNCRKSLVERKDLLDIIKNSNFDIVMTLGAADLDRLLPEIKHILLQSAKD